MDQPRHVRVQAFEGERKRKESQEADRKVREQATCDGCNARDVSGTGRRRRTGRYASHRQRVTGVTPGM